jgi:hypothetical protein
MGDWYILVGLVVAGITGYILHNKFPDDAGWTVVVPWGLIVFWGPIFLFSLALIPVLAGVYIGKIFLHVGKKSWPTIVNIWKAFD